MRMNNLISSIRLNFPEEGVEGMDPPSPAYPMHDSYLNLCFTCSIHEHACVNDMLTFKVALAPSYRLVRETLYVAAMPHIVIQLNL